ncbi:MAG: bi-domain-containing oxidoreductase [Chryseolinea sp.]
MKQLIQNFKTGKLYVDDVPMPSVSEGMVLVENKFSLISSGTERSTVQVAQANLLGKARQRPDLVAQVLANIKKEGLAATLAKVRTKLDSLKAMGYSTAGTVLTSLDKQGTFQAGDRVACAGQGYASHAEIVSVPENLVVKIPEGVSFEEAAFTTLGAIALQGIRQAEPRLGEKVCVIGLGLLGQLSVQLLKANGCDVFGIDVSDRLVELTKELSGVSALNRNHANLLTACENFTHGHGFDAVIITAAAPTNDPIVLATEISRKKGKIVVVGAVKMDVPREPHFYKKELELKISCSYGPGRYDTDYEERGVDYPFAYVRWTEQRNMQAFLEMIAKGLVNVKPLVTHTFDIDNAEKAYEIVLGKNPQPHIGILLLYAERDEKTSSLKQLRSEPVKQVNVGFIGAGSFAQSYLIPNVKAFGASLDTVVTSKGITSKNVAEKFGFNSCSSQATDILDKASINTVFIATPHSSHAEQVIKSLIANKNVFVEKPLAVDEAQLNQIIETKDVHNHPLMVGFNRRFAPICVSAKKEFESIGEPMVINIRVNAGFIGKDHWTQIPEIGAGRIIGEMCHFIDLMQYFTNGEPVLVYADCIYSKNEKLKPDDNIAIIVKFNNGCLGNLTYVANGDKSLPKEHIEIFGGGKVAVIEDFRSGTFYHNNKSRKVASEGKGHAQEVKAFLTSLVEGKESPISFRSVCLTTLTTFKIVDSLKTGLPQQIQLNA